jgi:hypothetical protein
MALKGSGAASMKEAQSQLREIAEKTKASLEEEIIEDTKEGKDPSEAIAKKNVATSAFKVWETGFAYMEEQLYAFTKGEDTDFEKGDVYKCVKAAHDCASLFAALIKKKEQVDIDESREMLIARAAAALERTGEEIH